jgi:alginate O-acetyltransferase complex protein AlgJ
MKYPKLRIYGVLFVFVIALSFPLVNDNLKVVNDDQSFENRGLASRPSYDSVFTEAFPKKLDQYYNDHFTLRNKMIKGYNLYNILVFKKSPLPDRLIIGSDGWLFTAFEDFESFQGKNRFTPEELDTFKMELEYRQKYLNDRGCKFYFVIAPGKPSIYPEKIGHEYYRLNTQTWGEQLLEYLDKHSTVRTINLFEVFRQKKAEHQLYYKLDTHWNSIAGFYAANEIFKKLKIDFPSIELFPLSDFDIIIGDECGGDIQSMLGKLAIYSEPCVRVAPKMPVKAVEGASGNYPAPESFPYPQLFEVDREIKSPLATGPRKPKMLMVTDSYGEYIFPFLAENFSRSVKIWDGWRYELNENIVESEKPQIFLLMINEPKLRWVLHHQSRPPAPKKSFGPGQASLKQS